MKAEIKAFDETTLDDAKKVVSEMFSPEVCPLLDKMLANPLRRELGVPAAGEIAYQDGKPVAFQGAILRRLFVGQKPIVGVVGSTLCSKPETSPVLLMNLMKATMKPRGGSKLFFANTACDASFKMNRLLGASAYCPQSYLSRRYKVIRCLPFLLYIIRRKVFKLPIPKWRFFDANKIDLREREGLYEIKRIREFVQQDFDSLFASCLEANKGVILSRTSGELQYMFGDRMKSSKCVAIGAYKAEKLEGYIILESEDVGCRRWRILDMLAVGNCHAILELLIVRTFCFLRKTPAIFLEATGFSDAHQIVFSRTIPRCVEFHGNYSLYKIETGSGISEAILQSPDSWFFGPYDGDMCL